MKVHTLCLLSGVALFAGVSTAGLAEEKKADPSIAYRHHAMELVKDAADGLLAIVKREEGGVPEDFGAHATTLAAGAHASEFAFSKKVKGGDTKDVAFEKWDDFSEKFDKFVLDADALAAVEGADMKTKAAAVKKALSHCKACHDDYREEEK